MSTSRCLDVHNLQAKKTVSVLTDIYLYSPYLIVPLPVKISIMTIGAANNT